MRARIGNFLFIIGILVLIVFIGSDLTKKPQYLLFIGGLFLIIWGVLWIRKGFTPSSTPDNRFGLIRKISNKKKKTQETLPKK